MIIHNDFKDFILFLYVHISRADENYDPDEMQTIKKKIEGLVGKDADIEKKLYIAIREYNSFDKTKLTVLFNDSFKHFSNNETVLKSNFYNDLNEIILADGKVQDAETKALRALKEIIESHSEKI
ncbi:TerB family tellurite resistance protein [Chryseolinea sp. H1M3-3]|uniref:tellurite resistance TerB family protein n=1 Tax=Chryseolinea sp. H1M3-3 TaxID=3034144 RepID=UPI0023EC3EC4|nr:TerB family tellurite resistance protein [Chryseolinea sp. H1M3-3]